MTETEPYILTYRDGTREEHPTADAWYEAYQTMQKKAEPKWRSTLHAMNTVAIGRYKEEKGITS